jgi:hypothetical protein
MSFREWTRAKARFCYVLPSSSRASRIGGGSADGPPSAAESQKLVDGAVGSRIDRSTQRFLRVRESRRKAAAPAIVVACSDMSMPVPGALRPALRSVFVVRIVGPVPTPSPWEHEQAATALRSRLLVILGHDGATR